MEKLDKHHRIRHANLIALVREHGSQSAFGAAVGRTKEQINPLFKGTKGIGPKLARDIEELCGKPKYWMDESHLETQDEELAQLIQRGVEECPEDVKSLLSAFFQGRDGKTP